MIELLFFLIFSWIFGRKIWKGIFKEIKSFFKSVIKFILYPFKRRNTSIVVNVGRGIIKLLKWVFFVIFQILHWCIKRIYELFDYLKMKLWI
jgi:hypothetical protein